jgi:hypothetical protein
MPPFQAGMVPKDMTNLDLSPDQKKKEKLIADLEQIRAKAIESRDYKRLSELNEEIKRLKAELHR